MKYFYLLIIFLLPALPGLAQKKNTAIIDSYLSVLPGVATDTGKARIYTILSALYPTVNPDTGIIYGNMGLEIYKREHISKGMAKAYNSLGQNYFNKNDYPVSMQNYYAALKIYEDLSDTVDMAAVLGNIGGIYNEQKDYAKALAKDSTALSYYIRLKNKKGIARNLGNMGVVYDNMQKYDSALKYYSRAIQVDKESGDLADVAKNHSNMAGAYYNLGDLNMAVTYNDSALKIYEKIGDKKSLAINYVNLGAFLVEVAKMDKTKVQPNHIIAATKEENLANALKYLEQSIKEAEAIGFQQGLVAARETLYDVYMLKKDYKLALENYIQKTDIIQNIMDADTKVKITKMETQREKELLDKQIQISELKKANEQKLSLIWAGVSIVLIVVVIIILRSLYFQLNSNKQLAKEKKKHLERIRVQSSILMEVAFTQSHEIRGPVSTIMGLSELFNYDDMSDPNNKVLMEGINSVSHRLDKVITELVNKENQLKNESAAEDMTEEGSKA